MSDHAELQLFADYFQFYLADSDFKTDTAEIWDSAATDRMLASGEDFLAVGTARNMTVPVWLEMRSHQPEDDLEAWQQVIDCSINIASGAIVALGCTDYLPDAHRQSVSPGWHRARVSYRGLDTLSEDGLDGEDVYRVQLWPEEWSALQVVKCRPQDVLPRI